MRKKRGSAELNYELIGCVAKSYEEEMLKIYSKYSYFWMLLRHVYLNRKYTYLPKYVRIRNGDIKRIKGYKSIIDSLETPILDTPERYILSTLRPKREVLYTLSRKMTLPLEEQKIVDELNKCYISAVINPLVENNIKLAFDRVHKISSNGTSLKDRLQAGLCGLTIAAHKYDFNRNIRFSTYAVYWIDQEIRAGVSKDMYKVYVPMNIRDKITTMYKNDDIDEELQTIYESTTNILSLDLPSLTTDCDTPMYNAIVYEQEEYEEIEKREAWYKLKERCKKILGEVEYYVLIKRYGLFGNNRETLKSIGKKLGMTGEYVRQIEESILNKLKKDKECLEILRCLWDSMVAV